MDIQLKKKTGLAAIRPWQWAAAAAAVIIAILVVLSLTGSFGTSLSVDRARLSIAEITDGQFDDFVRIDGRVQPISVVQLSPQEGGMVVEKVVEEGAAVRRGDLILRLTNANLDLQILNAEADLAEKQNILRNTRIAMEQELLNNRTEKAQTDLDVARKQRAFEQKERLYRSDLIAREEFIQAREDFELARRRQELISQRLEQDSIYRLSQIDQMEENLANMQRNVVLIRQRKDYLNVTSPIDGELGLLDVELGASVNAGEKIGQINDLTNYKVTALIDEHYIDRVVQGLSGTLERSGSAYDLTVRKVYPEVRDGKFRTDLVFTGERPENIRSGQTYYINLQLGQPAQCVLIPRGTFYSSTGGNWIFVVDPDGKHAYRRNIRLGRQNPRFYEVVEGLEPGERVIVNGYEQFADYNTLIIN